MSGLGSPTDLTTGRAGPEPVGYRDFEFWYPASTNIGHWPLMKTAAQMASAWTGRKVERLLHDPHCKLFRHSLKPLSDADGRKIYEGFTACHQHFSKSDRTTQIVARPCSLKNFQKHLARMRKAYSVLVNTTARGKANRSFAEVEDCHTMEGVTHNASRERVDEVIKEIPERWREDLLDPVHGRKACVGNQFTEEKEIEAKTKAEESTGEEDNNETNARPTGSSRKRKDPPGHGGSGKPDESDMAANPLPKKPRFPIRQRARKRPGACADSEELRQAWTATVELEPTLATQEKKEEDRFKSLAAVDTALRLRNTPAKQRRTSGGSGARKGNATVRSNQFSRVVPEETQPEEDTERPPPSPPCPKLDPALLYQGDIPKDIYFACERYSPVVDQKTGQVKCCTKGGTEHLQANGEGVDRIVFTRMSRMSLTLTRDSKSIAHGHAIGATKFNGHRKMCDEAGIPCSVLDTCRDYCGKFDSFVKVVQGDSPKFRELFPPEEFRADLPFIARTLLSKLDGPVDDMRGNVRVDFGFTSRNWDDKHLENEGQESVLCPLKPFRVEEPTLMERSGPLLRLLNDAICSLFSDDKVRPFPDAQRTLVAGKVFAAMCKIYNPFNNFHLEGASWALNVLGLVEHGIDIRRLLAMVLRHFDDKDDDRPGHDYSGSSSFVLVVDKCIVRLTLIPHLRCCVGDCVDKEFGCAKDVVEKLWTRLQGRPAHRTCDFPKMVVSMEPLQEVIGIHCVVHWATLAFPCKCGVHSTVVHGIRRMREFYPSLKWKHFVELVLVGAPLNNQFTPYVVFFKRWLSDCPLVPAGTEVPAEMNLVIEFFRECRKCGIKGPISVPPKLNRCFGTSGRWLGICDAEFKDWTDDCKGQEQEKSWIEKCHNEEDLAAAEAAKTKLDGHVQELSKILLRANRGGPANCTSELIDKAVEEIPFIRDFTAQCIFPVAVLAGLVTRTDHALCARIAEANPACDDPENRGCNTNERRDALLKWVARAISHRGIDFEESFVEGEICEDGRKTERHDFFFEETPVYDLQEKQVVHKFITQLQWSAAKKLDCHHAG